MLRITILRMLAVCGLGMGTISGSAFAQVQNFEIPQGDLKSALDAYSKQAGVQVIYRVDDVRGVATSGAHGSLDPAAALDAILAKTGFTISREKSGAIAIVKVSPSPPDPGKKSVNTTSVSNGDTGKTLDTIIVTGFAEGLAATRSATPLKEIPQTVSVISRETLDQQNATDLASALNQAPGITLVQNSSQQTYLYSRGFQIQTIHVDGGAPVSLIGGAVDASALDTAEFDHIEVLRGADALFGGSGQPGATVSEQRKRPTSTLQGSFEAWLGSWDQYRVSGDLSGPLNTDGTARGRVVVADSDQNFYYHPADTHKSLFYGIFEYDISLNTLLTVGGSYNKLSGVLNFNGLPFYDTGADSHLPRSLSLTTPWSKSDTEQTEVFAKLEHQFNDEWKLRLSATNLRIDGSSLYASLFGPIDSTTHDLSSFGPYNGTLKSNQPLFDATLTGSFDWAGRRQELMVGADYQKNTGPTSIGIFHKYIDPLNPFTFDPSAWPAPMGAPYYLINVHNNQSQYGFYGAVRLRPLDDFSIIAGVRDSFYRYSATEVDTFNETPSAPFTSDVKDAGKVTPYAGVTYDLSKEYSLYASYADIYVSNQGALKADLSPLPPADGVNIEAGIKGSWNDGGLNGSLALFRIRQDGIAVYDPSAYVPGVDCCFLPALNKSKGVDTELTGQLSPNWQISAGYTFNINRTQARVALNSQTPRHLFKFWMNYSLPDSHWSIGGGLRAQSSNGVTECAAYDENYNCIKYGHAAQGFFTVADLRLAYSINKHWDVALSVNNVFDRRYYQTIELFEYGNWYGIPRSLLLKIQGKL